MTTNSHKRGFINNDLELISDEDLTPLADAWDNEAVALSNFNHKGKFHLGMEVCSCSEEGCRSYTASDIIIHFHELLSKSSPKVKGLWDRSESRVFDIGFESYSRPRKTHITDLPTEALQAVLEMKAFIRITLYPRTLEEDIEHEKWLNGSASDTEACNEPNDTEQKDFTISN